MPDELSRRDFIKGSIAATAVVASSTIAEAWTHGAPPSSTVELKADFSSTTSESWFFY